jgi:hypothetical protein
MLSPEEEYQIISEPSIKSIKFESKKCNSLIISNLCENMDLS